MRTRRTPLLLGATAFAAGSALLLSGCASGSAGDAAADGTIQVVASTNVYGSIAAEIGGDAVTVTSIIDSSAKDPHSYEATARDRLALSKAQLVIANGGGYDPFMQQLIGDSDADVLDAVDISGLAGDDHDHAEEETDAADGDAAETDDEHAGHGHIEGLNEHVWYDVHVVDEVAHEIAEHLGELAPDDARTFEDNYADFSARLDAVHDRLHELEEQYAGAKVTITEPVPLYLLEAAGLANVTPDAFSEAIEEGTDVSPLVLQQTLDLFSGDDIALLAYNAQTAGAETEKVRAAAEDAGVPVVDFAETLPDGQDYVEWMTSNVDAVEAALQK